MDEENLRVRPHLWIAGTGRAGTSFLVRYLTALGLDTQLKRSGEDGNWDDEANAGLESAPLPSLDDTLPYVVKSPWLYQFIDTLLTSGKFAADAVIIPVRDLAEAAVSRSIIERRAIHQNAPWMNQCDCTWEEWGHVPGGLTYSLNPLDQGRLLAVGFHHLIQRLVAAEIPIIFLAFPRFVDDAAYLFNRLSPVLPRTLGYSAASAAHRQVADPAKVRVGRGVEAKAPTESGSSGRIMDYGTGAALDAIAARRELGRLRNQIPALQAEARNAEDRRRSEHEAGAEQEAILRDRITMMEVSAVEASAALARASRRQAEEAQMLGEIIRQGHEHVQMLTQEVVQLRQQADLDNQTAQERQDTLKAILQSRSWRMTRPYRSIGLKLRSALRR